MLFILEIIAYLVLIYIVFSQVVVPKWKGERAFPWLRRRHVQYGIAAAHEELGTRRYQRIEKSLRQQIEEEEKEPTDESQPEPAPERQQRTEPAKPSNRRPTRPDPDPDGRQRRVSGGGRRRG